MHFIFHAFLLFVLAVFTNAAWAQAIVTDTFSQEELGQFRKNLQEKMDVLERDYQKEAAACHDQFLVNRCLSERKSRYTKEKQALRAEEIKANDRERTLKKEALAQKETRREEALIIESEKEAQGIDRFRRQEAEKQQAREAKRLAREKKAIEGRKDAERRHQKRRAIEERSSNPA